MDGNNTIGIGELATLITAAAAVVYVLGLLAVAWPIFAKITGNPIDTWYAVSLIPKTIVAGQGVRILLQFPLVATFYYGLMNLATSFATDVAILVTGSPAVRLVVKIVFMVATLSIIVALLSRPRIKWLFGSYAQVEEAPWKVVIWSTSLALLLAPILFYAGRLFRDAIVLSRIFDCHRKSYGTGPAFFRLYLSYSLYRSLLLCHSPQYRNPHYLQ